MNAKMIMSEYSQNSYFDMIRRRGVVRIYDLADRGNLSLYESLYRHIRDDILAGNLLPDDRLPSKRSLAADLGVSVITVEGAYRQLQAEGYIVSRERSGYYVRSIATRPHATRPVSSRAVTSRPTFAVADFSSAPACSDRSFARLWEKTLRDVIAHESEQDLFARQPPQGSQRLRECIASWLARARGITTGPDRIVVAAGAPMLYGLVALMRGRRGRAGAVALESPGYGMIKGIYETMGWRVAPMPLDAEGIDCSMLEKSAASLVHVMPSHQFPTGRVTTVSRRYELLRWASQAGDRYIVEDDYDWEFRLSGKPIPSLSSIDAEGKVIYLSTFSKSLSPSLRIAFGVFPSELDEDLERVLGCFASTVGTIDQIALARLMESGGYERHVGRYRTKARAARDCLIGAFRESPIAGRLSYEECDSGLHFVLCVDTPARAEDIARRAAERGVGLAPLERYDLGGMMASDGRVRFVMQHDGIECETLMRAAVIVCESIERAERRQAK